MNSQWRSAAIATAMAAALSVGCSKAREQGAGEGEGLNLTLESAAVTAERRVQVTYRLTDRAGGARGAGNVENRWTLARLGEDPAGLPGYVALVRTGADVTLNGVTEKQPGFETGGAVEDLGDGRFRYTYEAVLPEGSPQGATYRVGVFSRLRTGTSGEGSSAAPVYSDDQPNAVLDFVPNGGAPQKREVVADTGCATCHVEVRAHGDFRRGVAICTTCHTYQLYDPDTRDPARPDDPNPLDLGRMVHRIHRGTELPTVANVAAAAAAAQGDAQVEALAAPQAKFSVVGFGGQEIVYGQVLRRDERETSTLVRAGVAYPQDLRNCDACHVAGAEDAADILQSASKRACQGCHADVHFESTTPPSPYHRLHPPVIGFPFRPDVAATCNLCHGGSGELWDERIGTAHVEPHESPVYNPLQLTIVDVTSTGRGENPVLTFEVRNGDGSPVTNLSTLDSLNAVISGPTTEYAYTTAFLSQPLRAAAVAVTGADGRYTYTFVNRAGDAPVIPADATGTWSVALEGRRINTAITAHERGLGNLGATANFYDKPNNPIRDFSVDGSEIQHRRTVATTESCNACHHVLSIHGGQRNEVAYCTMCHTYDATDWGNTVPTPAPAGQIPAGRPKTAGEGGAVSVNVAATPDGLEERSIHLKPMIHKIHTGERLEVSKPYAIYGFRSSLFFFDEIRVPELARSTCTTCHVDGTFTLDAVPAFAQPTIANETGDLLHTGTNRHAPGEPSQPKMQAACLSCHDTPSAYGHALNFTLPDGSERCLECHSEGPGSIAGVRESHFR